MAPVLGYWNIRGLASQIRLLLEYAGVEYEEKRYEAGPPPDFDRAEWSKDKADTLGLKFPNLPYYIDDDVKITQSHVILRYLARKHGLHGKTELDQANVDLLATQVYDYQMDYAKIAYNPEFSKLKVDYLKAMPDKLKLLANFLGTNKFVAGDYVTYADFVLFEFFEAQTFFEKDILKDFPTLEEYHKRVLALEPVSKYYNSPRAIKYPFNGAPAYFGGQYSDQLSNQQ